MKFLEDREYDQHFSNPIGIFLDWCGKCDTSTKEDTLYSTFLSQSFIFNNPNAFNGRRFRQHLRSPESVTPQVIEDISFLIGTHLGHTNHTTWRGGMQPCSPPYILTLYLELPRGLHLQLCSCRSRYLCICVDIAPSFTRCTSSCLSFGMATGFWTENRSWVRKVWDGCNKLDGMHRTGQYSDGML